MKSAFFRYDAEAVYMRLLGLMAFVLHVCCIKLPFVNLEWVFLDVAQAISNGQLHSDNAYFLYEANTLGMPILYAIVAKCLPMIPWICIPRLVSALSFLIVTEALLRIRRQLGITHSIGLIVIIFLNPLIWIYAGRGTADVFPMSIATLATALYWEKTPVFFSPHRIAAIVLMNVAIILKYHAALLIPLCCFGLLHQDSRLFLTKKQLLSMFVSVLFMVPGPLLYVIWAYKTLHFLVIPSHFHNTFHPSLRHVFGNFIIYMGYVCLLLLPFSLRQVVCYLHAKQYIIKSIGVGLLVFSFGYTVLQPDVEMNFGPLDAWLNLSILGGAFIVLAVILSAIYYQAVLCTTSERSHKNYLIAIMGGTICYLLFLSLTRPANRYLLFVLPLNYCLLWSIGELWKYKRIVYVGIGLYGLVNMYLMDYQNTQGLAAIKMVQQLEKQHLIALTDPGAIVGHVGNYFYATNNHFKKYTIVSGVSSAPLIVVKHQGFFSQKTYTLQRSAQHE